MNTENKIEHCLKSAPKPLTPNGLLDKLQTDVAIGEVGAQRSDNFSFRLRFPVSCSLMWITNNRMKFFN